jgi:DNA-directed RNA polymerase subunit L
MYQAGAGVAHLKEQYIVKTNGNSSSSSSSALSSSSSSTISFSSPNDNHGEAAPSRGLIRGRTKQQLGLVDVKKNNWKNSGKNFDDISNVLQRELMKRLKKHQYYFLPGTEEAGNRYGKKNDRSKKKEKKRTAPPMHCYQFLKNGYCNFGDECKYKHLTQQQLAEIDERTKNEQEISIKDNDATTSEAVITTDTCTSTTPSTTSDNTAAVDATKPDSVVVPSATPNLTPTTAVTTTTSAVAAPTKIFNERKTIDFHHKIYVAPLTTVGNLPFRRIMKDFGTDITCGEMALATNLLKANSSEWSLVRRHKCEDVFGIQVAGGDHRLMDRLSQVIENELDVDFVDLNMGCPLDFICGKGMGSKLMLRVNRVKNIVQSMTSRLSVPMTLKLRTGWSKTSPMAHSFLEKIPLWNMELCKNRTGGPAIQAVTIHGR